MKAGILLGMSEVRGTSVARIKKYEKLQRGSIDGKFVSDDNVFVSSTNTNHSKNVHCRQGN